MFWLGAFIPPAVRNKRQSRQAPWQRGPAAEGTAERARDRTPRRVPCRPSQQHTPQHRIQQPSYGCCARLQEHQQLQQPSCRTSQLDRCNAGCPCYTAQLWQQGCACQSCQHPRCSFDAPHHSSRPEEQEFDPDFLVAPSPQGKCEPPKRVHRTPAVAHPTSKPCSQRPSYHSEGLSNESRFSSSWDEWRETRIISEQEHLERRRLSTTCNED